ncbi:unnamed protein product [Lymnaea stagnalis]|uniref:Aldehyde dehydrogenase domain-containing protein n=1 Tax=Lymnaea stagnalis TaxID=6523 RepID=A0AAV2IGL2_LYMST
MAGIVTDGNAGHILGDLSYGSALDAENVALNWLEKNNKSFGLYINGQWVYPDGRQTKESKNPATGKVLATTIEATEDDIKNAVISSKEAFKTWSSLAPHVRSRYLYSIARNLQKNQSLLAIVEAIDSGKPTRETRGVDIPAIIRQFYHHAGWAQLKDTELSGWKPYGVTAVISHWSFPLMHLASRVAPALATGNTVIVFPSSKTRLSALLFAEICIQSGLPSGVVNVVTGSDSRLLVSNPDVDKVVFVGSVDDGRGVRKLTAGTGKSLSLELSGRSPILVFEEADLDSAVEGIVEAAFFNNGQVRNSRSRLLIQELVQTQLIEKLKARMSKLTVGNNMEKNNDLGPLTDPQLCQQLKQLVDGDHGGEKFQVNLVTSDQANYFPPTLIYNIQTSSQVYLEEFFGPLVTAIPFRTVKEGITLANHSVYGTSASVWTENLSVALEVASQLQVGTVWVNAHNLFDAAAGVGGCKASGFGRSGGKESLFEYVLPTWQNLQKPQNVNVDINKFGTASNSDLLPSASASGESPGWEFNKTYKLYYGGGQKRPDSGASLPVLNYKGEVIAHVPDGGRKDIRNAVEAAVKVTGSWGRKEGHGKAQIMYYIAENLQSRFSEYVGLLSAMTGQTESEATQEVDLSIQRLFYWAAYCDKYGGSVQESTFYGVTLKLNEPVGVIGIVCPENFPFLGFISLVAPAIARGNPVIVVPSGKYPLAALGFHQVLETSDVPAGVINIVTGDGDALTKTLAEHHDVNALWYFRSGEGSKFVEAASAGNLKRTWVSYGAERNFLDADQGQGGELLYHSTSSKNIWLPMGDIFAN